MCNMKPKTFEKYDFTFFVQDADEDKVTLPVEQGQWPAHASQGMGSVVIVEF